MSFNPTKNKRKSFYLSKDDNLIIDLIEESLKHAKAVNQENARYISLDYLNFRIICFHKDHMIIRIKYPDREYSLSHKDFTSSCRNLIEYLLTNKANNNINFPAYHKIFINKLSNLSPEHTNAILTCCQDFSKRSFLLETL